MTEAADRPKPGTPAELIVSAVQSEREAALFYRMMAEITGDRDVKETLRGLADDETSHATTLANLYFELTGNGITTSEPTEAEGSPNLLDFSSASKRDALAFALQNETRAAELYQAQADAADNQRVGTIFRILADTEREHAAYLRLQLDRLEASDDE
jgi:rubrerythrin